MEHKDFEKKLKEAMIDQTKDIEISPNLINKIMSNRQKTWKEKLREFLNKEIEIPLVPVIVGATALFVVSILPMEVFTQETTRTIDIGPSRIIIRDIKELGYNEN